VPECGIYGNWLVYVLVPVVCFVGVSVGEQVRGRGLAVKRLAVKRGYHTTWSGRVLVIKTMIEGAHLGWVVAPFLVPVSYGTGIGVATTKLIE